MAQPISLACTYTSDLFGLAAAVPAHSSPAWPTYKTPIRVENLVPYLESHPDAAFSSYIHEGLCNGFRVGFDYHNATLHKRGANHPSVFSNEKVVDNRIADEIIAGRLNGPLPPHHKPLAHISPMDLVPKPHQVNKFRLIMDLSHPNGGSVNDGISPSLCSLCYSSVDEAVDIRNLDRDTVGEARYQGCLPPHSCASGRPPPVGDLLER